MKYTEEEKKAIAILADLEFRRKTINYNKITLEDSQCAKIVLNIIEKQQKEIERYKRIAEMNLKDGEEFKNEMCEHRCILKSEMKENYISKEAIRNKIEELQEELKSYEEMNMGLLRHELISEVKVKIRTIKEILGDE